MNQVLITIFIYFFWKSHFEKKDDLFTKFGSDLIVNYNLIIFRIYFSNGMKFKNLNFGNKQQNHRLAKSHSFFWILQRIFKFVKS